MTVTLVQFILIHIFRVSCRLELDQYNEGKVDSELKIEFRKIRVYLIEDIDMELEAQQ